LTSAWSVTLDASPSSVHCHASPGVLAVGIDEREPTGPAVEIVSTVDGARRGRTALDYALSGTEYCASSDVLLAVTDHDLVYGIDPTTAESTWTAQAAGVGAVGDGTAFLYGGRTVWAYDTGDGDREWQTVVPDDVSGDFGYADGRLVLRLGDRGNDGIVALDPGTGETVWDYRPEPDTDHHTIGSSDVYVTAPGDDHGRVVKRIDPATGRERWRSDEYRGFSGLYVRDDGIFGRTETTGISTENHASVVRLDPDTGRTAWETAVRAGGDAIDGLDPGRRNLYFGTRANWSDGAGVEDGAAIHRLSRATGTRHWTVSADVGVSDIDGSADPVIVRTSYPDALYAVSEADGERQWSISDETLRVRATTDQCIVASEGRDREDLYVIDRKTGTVERTAIDEQYTVDGGAVFVTGRLSVDAYPIASAPEAFAGSSDPEEPTDTTDRSAAAGTDAGSGTDGHRRSASDGDGTTAVSFCPNCGADLSAYDGPNFCPECGEGIPE
jgi:outer membrane protein assembly factor BamB